MNKTVISIQNGLLAEAIERMLDDSGEFISVRIPVGGKKEDLTTLCREYGAQMLIAEVSYSADTSVDVRLKEAAEVREALPDCKIVFLCDENSAPDIARRVMLARQDRVIDAFFYSSVTARYMLAVLTSLFDTIL